MNAKRGRLQVFDAAAVAARLDYGKLVEALRAAFAEDVMAPTRTVHAIPSDVQPLGSLLCMPAWSDGGLIAVKLVTAFPGNSGSRRPSVSGVVVVFDAVHGQPLAVCDGAELTRRRTAAASALAADYLARADSRVLTIVGAGALAPHMARAFCAIRDIEQVGIWARRPEQARRVCRLLQRGASTRVVAVADLEAAVRESDIVSCCTSASTPVLYGRWLRPGTHVDAVGGYLPHLREVDDDVVTRSSIYVDRMHEALVEPGDIVDPLRRGLIAPSDIRGDLRMLVTRAAGQHRPAAAITFFKSVGHALEDLAAARCVIGAR